MLSGKAYLLLTIFTILSLTVIVVTASSQAVYLRLAVDIENPSVDMSDGVLRVDFTLVNRGFKSVCVEKVLVYDERGSVIAVIGDGTNELSHLPTCIPPFSSARLIVYEDMLLLPPPVAVVIAMNGEYYGLPVGMR